MKHVLVTTLLSILPLTFACEALALPNNTQIIAQLVAESDFKKSFPFGSTYCFSDRGVAYKVRIDGFSFNHQLVEFTYLNGAFSGQKGSTSYSTFVNNSC